MWPRFGDTNKPAGRVHYNSPMTEDPSAVESGPPPPCRLQWTFNPWQRNWRRPAGALALILLIAAIAGFCFTYPGWWPSMIGWGGIGLLLMLGMTTTIYLPTHYQLDERGVEVRFLGTRSFRKWDHYRNFYAHDTGVHLTTMPQPSRLDPFRGHYLLFNENREEILAFIKAQMKLRGEPERLS